MSRRKNSVIKHVEPDRTALHHHRDLHGGGDGLRDHRVRVRRSVNRIATDHRDLTELLERIDRPVVTEERPSRILLDELRDRLASHFRREELSPLYDELLGRRPHLARKLETFYDQHAEILETLDALMATAGPDACDIDSERLGKLVNRIRSHERAEDELIRRAFTEDLGAL